MVDHHGKVRHVDGIAIVDLLAKHLPK